MGTFSKLMDAPAPKKAPSMHAKAKHPKSKHHTAPGFLRPSMPKGIPEPPKFNMTREEGSLIGGKPDLATSTDEELAEGPMPPAQDELEDGKPAVVMHADHPSGHKLTIMLHGPRGMGNLKRMQV